MPVVQNVLTQRFEKDFNGFGIDSFTDLKRAIRAAMALSVRPAANNPTKNG